ncbi:MAG: hypothetical protein K0Q73_8098 [Paenibacillus sp.]|jgi:hypothetical protein|nr:hypothetical protein [Paenibacillus sp.]
MPPGGSDGIVIGIAVKHCLEQKYKNEKHIVCDSAFFRFCILYSILLLLQLLIKANPSIFHFC